MFVNSEENYSPRYIPHVQQNQVKKWHRSVHSAVPKKQISMGSLISWNILKAAEINPRLDLKVALQSAQDRLDIHDSDEKNSQSSEGRYVTCALLAWQQLGHASVDSLLEFIQNQEQKCRRSEHSPVDDESSYNQNASKHEVSSRLKGYIDYNNSKNSDDLDCPSNSSGPLMGPVVKLPHPEVVMRVGVPQKYQVDACHKTTVKPKKAKPDLNKKLDDACCMDPGCSQKLTDLDNAISKLRSRAARLARRGAERAELLERAEAAWRDLEHGFFRRLSLAEEKENDIIQQIKQAIKERNASKCACAELFASLNEREAGAETERAQYEDVEKQLCETACLRLRVTEDLAQVQSTFAEQQSKIVQVGRELQFKEDQARRKLMSLESERDSMLGLIIETERSYRFELGVLKEQIKEVGNQLLTKNSENEKVKKELNDLSKERDEIVGDMVKCKTMCETNVQGRVDVMNKKRDELKQLKEKVIECKCKVPQEMAVQVKRTPSLAALCDCESDEMMTECCSCTSLRTQLLLNFLKGLFCGIKSELNETGILMPCQLLKCLEDKHNWDRSSIIKTNLRNYFAKLLVGELDIAIATSIERCHARWTGKTCVDAIDKPSVSSDSNKWQTFQIEERRKFAGELANKFLNQKVEEFSVKEKKVLNEGPPPCECKQQQAAVYPCLVKVPVTTSPRKNKEAIYLKRIMQDLRQQLEDLKKDSIKIEDLKYMENKITNLVYRSTKISKANTKNKHKCMEEKPVICNNIQEIPKESPCSIKAGNIIKKRQLEIGIIKKCNKKGQKKQTGCIKKRSENQLKKIEQSFAVNLCLCSTKDVPSKFNVNNSVSHDLIRISNVNRTPKTKTSKSMILSKNEITRTNIIHKALTQVPCPSQYDCFHKIPSNTSIDKLLKTLTKWNGEVNKSIEVNTLRQNNNTLHIIKSLNKVVEENKYIMEMPVESMNLPIENIAQDILANSCEEAKSTHFNRILNTETKNILIFPTTESEYMGAINLDKSNDAFCKCVIDNNVEKQLTNVSCHLQIPYKCKATTSCLCESSQLAKGQEKQKHKKNISKFKKNSHAYSFIAMNSESSKTREKNQELTNENTNSIDLKDKRKEEIRGDSFMSDVANKSDFCPSNRDCFVKFLGVTLFDNSDKISKSGSDTIYPDNGQNLENEMTAIPSKSEKQINTLCYQKETSFCKLAMHCENDVQYNSQIKSTKLIEPGINIIYEKDEGKCVCCDDKDSTNDLELNAFSLLQTYLKDKITNLKQSENFSDMPVVEENKLFMSVLRKVKQVISENTPKEIPCNCLNETNDAGTWSRAYGLLLEYLKIKINKAQCSCLKTNEKRDINLPISIMDKITDLIEKDFERLSDKYKFVNKIVNTNKKDLKYESRNSLSYKNNIPYYMKKIFSMHDVGATNNISTQVPYYFSLINKPCDTVEDESEKKHMLEKVISCKLGNIMYITDCNCEEIDGVKYNLTKDIITNHCSSLVSKIQVDTKTSFNDINKTTDMKSCLMREENSKYNDELFRKEYETNPSLPYIGYTINCTCDRSLGSCICSKSIAQKNKDKIDYIWKSLTNQSVSKKMSYILHNIPKEEKLEIKKNISFVESKDKFDLRNAEPQSCKQHTKHKCDTNINTLDFEGELVLKGSDEKISCSQNDSYNLDESNFGIIGINTEYKSNSHKCGRIPRQNTNPYDTDTAKAIEGNHFYDSICSHDLIKNNEHVLNDCKEKMSYFNKCGCKNVPICHVKLLVENIENKLFYSKCTCDSLSSQVCPVHAKRK